MLLLRFAVVILLLSLAAAVLRYSFGGGQRNVAPQAFEAWVYARHQMQIGIASWYGPRFHGRKTASGERFDQDKLTAAHRTLRLGTRAEVTHEKNGRSVEVKINDRGPYRKGRIIDLSRAAAIQLGMKQAGLARVRIRPVHR